MKIVIVMNEIVLLVNNVVILVKEKDNKKNCFVKDYKEVV